MVSPVMQFDVNAYKDVLTRYATGVTIITTIGKERLCGITANSFTSVSLEPPLILFCISKSSSSCSDFIGAEFFAVNILAAQQKELAKHFASKIYNKFDGIEYSFSDHNCPIFPSALSIIEAQKEICYDGGDHFIILGRVTSFRNTEEAQPLIYFERDFRQIENF